MVQSSKRAETVKKKADVATEPRFRTNEVIFGAVEVTLFLFEFQNTMTCYFIRYMHSHIRLSFII